MEANELIGNLLNHVLKKNTSIVSDDKNRPIITVVVNILSTEGKKNLGDFYVQFFIEKVFSGAEMQNISNSLKDATGLPINNKNILIEIADIDFLKVTMPFQTFEISSKTDAKLRVPL